MSAELWMVGCGRVFEAIAACWGAAEPNTALNLVRLASTDAIAAPLEERLAGASDEARFFAAVDQSALNYARFDLYGRLRLGGRKFRSLVHPAAVVDATVQIGENCWIGPGAVVEDGVKLGHNTFVGTGALVLGGAELAAHAWIGAGARVGHGARIGTHTVLGADVRIAAGMTIGRHCSIESPGDYATPIADRTFVDPLFSKPVRIYGSHRSRNAQHP